MIHTTKTTATIRGQTHLAQQLRPQRAQRPRRCLLDNKLPFVSRFGRISDTCQLGASQTSHWQGAVFCRQNCLFSLGRPFLQQVDRGDPSFAILDNCKTCPVAPLPGRTRWKARSPLATAVAGPMIIISKAILEAQLPMSK